MSLMNHHQAFFSSLEEIPSSRFFTLMLYITNDQEFFTLTLEGLQLFEM
jgi:hypothetical protein